MKKTLRIGRSPSPAPSARLQGVVEAATQTAYYKKIEAEAKRRLAAGADGYEVEKWIERKMVNWGEPGEYTVSVR